MEPVVLFELSLILVSSGLLAYVLAYRWDTLNTGRTLGLKMPYFIKLIMKLNCLVSAGVLLAILVIAILFLK